MEAEGLLSCSQELRTGSYLELVENTPHPHAPFLLTGVFQYYSPVYILVSQALSSIQGFRQFFLFSVASLHCIIRTCFDYIIFIDLII
jgi:hypothetical protein